MIQPAALSPIAQQPQAYIGPNETTLRKNILEKVAIFGILLGSGLLLAPFFTAFTAIPLIASTALTALSAYAFHYLSNIDSSRALTKAAEAADRCMLNFLLFLGANPNANPNDNALDRAIIFGYSDIVRDLLNAGANPNNRDNGPCDKYDRTFLCEAIVMHQDEAVKMLLEHGADPTIRTTNMDKNLIDYALDEQQRYQQNQGDGYMWGDTRTREERKAAADRIVEMLRPYREDQPLPPSE